MEGHDHRSYYRSSIERFNHSPQQDYCNIRGPKRGSSTAALRQPYRASLNIEEVCSSPIQNLCRIRCPVEPEVVALEYMDRPNPYRLRQDSSRNIIAPSHESIHSIERERRDIPLKRFERPYRDYTPTSLIPSVKPTEAFKEDVLRVVQPLLDDLREEIGQGEVKISPKVEEVKSQPATTDNSKFKSFEAELNRLENLIKELTKASSANSEKSEKTISALESRLKKVEAKPDIECECQCKALNIPQKFSDVNKHISSLENAHKELKSTVNNTPSGSSIDPEVIEKIEKKIDEHDKKLAIISGLFDELTTNVDELDSKTDVIHKNLDTKIKNLDITKFDVINEDTLTQKLTQLEKKIGNTQAASLESIQDQIENLEKEIETINSEFSTKLSGLSNKPSSVDPSVVKNLVDEINALASKVDDIGRFKSIT